MQPSIDMPPPPERRILRVVLYIERLSEGHGVVRGGRSGDQRADPLHAHAVQRAVLQRSGLLVVQLCASSRRVPCRFPNARVNPGAIVLALEVPVTKGKQLVVGCRPSARRNGQTGEKCVAVECRPLPPPPSRPRDAGQTAWPRRRLFIYTRHFNRCVKTVFLARRQFRRFLRADRESVERRRWTASIGAAMIGDANARFCLLAGGGRL